jgi:hypothetical protein
MVLTAASPGCLPLPHLIINIIFPVCLNFYLLFRSNTVLRQGHVHWTLFIPPYSRVFAHFP